MVFIIVFIVPFRSIVSINDDDDDDDHHHHHYFHDNTNRESLLVFSSIMCIVMSLLSFGLIDDDEINGEPMLIFNPIVFILMFLLSCSFIHDKNQRKSILVFTSNMLIVVPLVLFRSIDNINDDDRHSTTRTIAG